MVFTKTDYRGFRSSCPLLPLPLFSRAQACIGVHGTKKVATDSQFKPPCPHAFQHVYCSSFNRWLVPILQKEIRKTASYMLLKNYLVSVCPTTRVLAPNTTVDTDTVLTSLAEGGQEATPLTSSKTCASIQNSTEHKSTIIDQYAGKHKHKQPAHRENVKRKLGARKSKPSRPPKY